MKMHPLLALTLAASLPLTSFAAESGTRPAALVSLGTLKNQLTALQGNISATMAALEKVKEAGKEPGALETAQTQFNSRLIPLVSQIEAIRRDAIIVKVRAKEHYDHWQREIAAVQNPKIREKAQDRLKESHGQYDKIIATATEAKEQLAPFLSDLRDIAVYLEADTSHDAVKTLSNTIWKLNNKSKSVNSSIGDVVEQIDRTMTTLPKS